MTIEIMNRHKIAGLFFETIEGYPFITIGRSLRLSFDKQTYLSSEEKCQQIWHSLTLVDCEEVIVAVIVSENGENLETRIIHNESQLFRFLVEYSGQNDEYHTEIFVDIGDWIDKENKCIQNFEESSYE